MSLPPRAGKLRRMSPEEIEAHCMALPGTTRVVQWGGSHVYKVGGKVFAIYAGRRDGVTVKCADAETAEFLIEIGAAVRAPHLPRGGWISVTADAEALDERLQVSYETVRAGLPKAAREALE
ncbi:MmcQ/YjbR family DNA-binding protein [Algicella marina]|uniref:MmcQ/YjbR family DNA-binding protein n=1 Tax=Algicella marina TaxID=2683284 RepID=UPI0024DFA050|nr:MmcQ/YjbR family DNA-binding protein [Algicella marina]